MKNLKVTVNGIEYSVQVEELGEETLNIGNKQNTQSKEKSEIKTDLEPKKEAETLSPVSDNDGIKAPMPGTIISVNVVKGDKVSKGQILIVLEAMKMENEIISPKDGVVESVNVNKGENVESGSLLVVIK